jgi:hypothetical protein
MIALPAVFVIAQYVSPSASCLVPCPALLLALFADVLCVNLNLIRSCKYCGRWNALRCMEQNGAYRTRLI